MFSLRNIFNPARKQGEQLLAMLNRTGCDEAQARALILAGADVNVANDVGMTPLMAACQYGYLETAKLLVAQGAALNAQDEHGRTALMWSCIHTKPDLLNFMIASKADVDLPMHQGTTPLMSVADDIHGVEKDMALALIAAGANINVQNPLTFRHGWTPLMHTVYFGTDVVSDALLKKGAALDVQNGDGDTALTLAATSCWNEYAIRALVEAGADLEIKNNAGDNAVSLIRKSGKQPMIDYLAQEMDRRRAETISQNMTVEKDTVLRNVPTISVRKRAAAPVA